MRPALFVFAGLLVIANSGSAKTIQVPGDYTTIQEGIDAAVDGDTVLVAPATYMENIDYKGKTITVRSSGGPHVTVIDAKNYGSVVTIQSGEGPDTVLEGFTITNGRGTYFWPDILLGGGIYCVHSSPKITGNIIRDNSAWTFGGGIYCWINTSLLITNNIIMNNTTYGNGGGIFCYGTSPMILNNTIMENAATFGGGVGCRSADVIIANSILWNNTASLGPEISVTASSAPSTLTISYSDVKGGQSSTQVEPNCTLNWGPRMIDADPLFVDPANGDLHLTFNSPCRGSGNNSAVKVLTDFEGDPRIAYGTVDMGADEFYTHLYWTGNAKPGGNVEVKFVGLPGTTPVGLCIGTGVLDPPIPSIWGDWYLQFPIMGPIDLWKIPSPDGVLVVPGTIPSSPPPPYSIPMQALIGIELTNLCILDVQ